MQVYLPQKEKKENQLEFIAQKENPKIRKR